MIVKLDKDRAYTEGTKGTKGMSDHIFYYLKNGFGIVPRQRERIKFLGIKHDKDLDFLDMLELSTQKNGDVLRWHKKQ